MDKYRILITVSDDGYQAVVPELPTCRVEGNTRAEALAKLEEALPAHIENMRDNGEDVPEPIDAQEVDGRLEARVSSQLHRELLFQAKAQNLDLAHFISELLLRGMFHTPRPRRNSSSSAGSDRGNRGNRRRGMDHDRYHGIMENRADFIEYVRQLDKGGGGGGGGRGGRGRRG